MKHVVVRAALVVSSLLFLAIVSEVSLRAFRLLDLDWRMVEHHPVRIETLAPDYDGSFRGTRVKTNAFGHRVPTSKAKDYTAHKPPQSKRVLVFGDSMTFGAEWPAETSFPEQLQDLLDPTFTQIQVLNFGVPGYGPYQEWNYIQESALGFEPDVVIVAFCEANDLSPVVPQNDARASDRIKLWMRRHLLLYSVAFDVWYNGRKSELAESLRKRVGLWSEEAASDPPNNPEDRSLSPDPSTFLEKSLPQARQNYAKAEDEIRRNGMGWQQTLQSFRAIRTYLDQRHIPLIIVSLPQNWNVLCGAWACRGDTMPFSVFTQQGQFFYQALDAALGSSASRYVSMRRAFADHSLQDLADIRETGHYGPKKNGMVARALLPVIRSLIAEHETAR